MDNDLDRKAIVEQTVVEVLKRSGNRGRSRRFEIFQAVITPITVAVIGVIATVTVGYVGTQSSQRLADAQVENAAQIARAQIESAEKVAAAQRDDTRNISEAERKIEELNQIQPKFAKIIQPDGEVADETVIAEIKSLDVYRDTALPFLLRIEQHYKKKGESSFASAARQAIEDILSNTQLDLSGIDFACQDRKRLLRKARFENYNLSGANFQACNLYLARFQNSALMNADFGGADLHGANFQNANLTGAKFDEKSNLRRADFSFSKLDDVELSGARNLQDAIFSLGALLKIDEAPFNDVPGGVLLRLLARHKEALSNFNPSDERLEALCDHLQIQPSKCQERLTEPK